MTTTDESESTAAPAARPRSLAATYIRSADRLYGGFAACMAVAWIVAAARTGEGWPHVFRNAGVLLLFLGLWPLRLTEGKALRASALLRIGLACVLLPFNYLQTGPLVSALASDAPAAIEAVLARGDVVLLGEGFHDWLLSIRHPLTTEILQWCYGVFFLLPLTLLAVLVLRGKRAQAYVLLFVIPATFLISYALYLVLPARSPGFIHEHLAPQEGLWLAPYLWAQIRDAAQGVYDAFPSGHTAVTLVVLWYAWRLDRVAFAILMPVGTGLIVSTIYLQYHYLLDLPAGALLALAVIGWEAALRRRWQLSASGATNLQRARPPAEGTAHASDAAHAPVARPAPHARLRLLGGRRDRRAGPR